MNEDILAKLHDIKELEQIPDNSVFLFSSSYPSNNNYISYC